MKRLIEQIWLHNVAGIGVTAEVAIGQFGHHTSAWGTLDETFHDEEWLVDLLHRAGILADGGGDGCQSYGPTLELVDDGQ